MQRPLILAIGARLILLGGLILALNLSAQPHAVQRDWRLLRLALESSRPGVAAASLDRLAAAQPWREDLRWAAARYALQAGDWAHGIRWMGMLAQDRLSAQDWQLLGDAYLAQQDWGRAEHAWEQALARQETPALYERLYDLHHMLADLPKATADLQRLARLQPEDPELAFRLALHLAAFDPSAALHQVEQIPPGASAALSARIAQLERRLQAALLAEQPEAQLLAAGQALAELNEWRLAKEAFQQALRLNPSYAEAWSFLGEARQRLDPPESEQALDDLRRGLWLRPDSTTALSLLALYWQRQGDLARAAGLYRSAAAYDPTNSAWFAALGALESAQGNLAAAEWCYRYAVHLAPAQALYWRLLANFYLLNQIHLRSAALPAARQAVSLAPEQPENLVTLGQVLLFLEETHEARRLFLQALERDASYAPAYLQLGILELYAGKGEQARRLLRAARDLAADPSTADQAERLLQYYFP